MVKVTINPTTNLVVNPTKNAEYSYIRVEELAISMENGFAREEKRSAIINGKTELLDKLGYVNGQILVGKIVAKESLTPFAPGQEPKKAGKDGAVITSNGQPVYRQTYFTSDMDAKDELIAFDKVSATASAPAANVAVGA